MKKILALVVVVLAAFLLFGGKSNHLVILHLNDTHSHFEPIRSGSDSLRGGVIERAAYIDSVRNAEGAENVLLLHAGDFSQGTSYFTQLGGDLEIDAINAFGYDVVTLGNHEFDNGPEELARRLANLNCPVVCANYDFSTFELGKIVKPYAIVEKAGMKIGVFGLLTNILKVVDRSVSDRMPKFDDVEVANKWADYLKNEEKCDLVIALTHLGYDTRDFDDIEMVNATRNIDLVVGGHSHTFLEKMESAKNLDGKDVPIVQDGCWGLNIGRIDIRK
ncbi:MAG: metallophosphatase [Bacteroidales bacterium]|nr:metallophosphatase [Bacteroidales bacterium]